MLIEGPRSSAVSVQTASRTTWSLACSVAPSSFPFSHTMRLETPRYERHITESAGRVGASGHVVFWFGALVLERKDGGLFLPAHRRGMSGAGRSYPCLRSPSPVSLDALGA